jgi:hypothetical protein
VKAWEGSCFELDRGHGGLASEMMKTLDTVKNQVKDVLGNRARPSYHSRFPVPLVDTI